MSTENHNWLLTLIPAIYLFPSIWLIIAALFVYCHFVIDTCRSISLSQLVSLILEMSMEHTYMLVMGFYQSLTLINSFFNQESSLTHSLAGFVTFWTVTTALRASGNWVDEWLPQIITFFTFCELTPLPIFLAICKNKTKKTLKLYCC